MDKGYYFDKAKGQSSYEFYPKPQTSINITQKYFNERVPLEPVEIIENTLYWIASEEAPKCEEDAYYFNTDKCTELQYDPFHKDFGPLNLAMTHRFWCELTKLLHERKDEEWKIFHHSAAIGQNMANSACLMGAFMLIVLQRTPEDIWNTFVDYHNEIMPFRDASSGECTYMLNILDCLKGLEKAIELGWYDFKTFDVQEYEYYSKLDNGDLNWVIPGKICALMGPCDTNYDSDGLRWHTPEDYSKLFESLGVERIIRLNEQCYEKNRFEKYGFKHNDLFFVDGSTPSIEIVNAFIDLVDNTKGATAVHCKAGLGRTGTLIGWYAMKRYSFPAAAFIGWIRLARPGSVLGPQQHFLIGIEDEMIYGNRSYNRFRDPNTIIRGADSPYRKDLEMSPYERITSKYGDEKQATRLLTAKKLRESMKFR